MQNDFRSTSLELIPVLDGFEYQQAMLGKSIQLNFTLKVPITTTADDAFESLSLSFFLFCLYFIENKS